MGMRKVTGFLAGFACALAALWLSAAAAQPGKAPHVQASLIAAKTAVRPGETITVALRQSIAPGWHTYWSNPGDAGEPTSLQWKLPDGATAGQLLWPVPHVIAIGPLVDYGYSDEVLLLTEITLPQSLPQDGVEIAADAKWLVCKEICVPEETTVSLKLPVLPEGLTPRASPNAAVIEAARAQLPGAAPWTVRFEAGRTTLMLRAEMPGADMAKAEFRFFPAQPDVIANASPQKASLQDGEFLLRMRRADADPASTLPANVSGILAVETRGASGQMQRRGYNIAAAIASSPRADVAWPQVTPAAITFENPTEVAGGSGQLSFALALLSAFVGGLILNLMPCVFPVLSLKALSLAGERAPHERHIHGGAYLAGVLASFLIAGVALIALREAGVSIGWGMQFQSPAFVLLLLAMFMGLGLNMSGVFAMGGRLAGIGDSLTRAPGVTGYFFTGVLATVVATPCTAPYMGAAVFYAFTQPAPQLLAVLMALGLGFALPMVLLSVSPSVGRMLPKPGAWMVTFKQVMAFPLYATAGWLIWVLSVQLGSDGVLAGVIAALGVAFAAWLIGSANEPGVWRTSIAAAIAVVAIVGSVLTAQADGSGVSRSVVTGETAGPKAEAFSAARLEELRAEGKPVFVNLTAAWCITCLVNERVALRSDRITEAFAKRGVVYLKGDWTNGNPEITALLKRFDRAGVPLYIIYAGKGEPQVLPQFLTESIVLDGIAALPQQQAKSE